MWSIHSLIEPTRHLELYNKTGSQSPARVVSPRPQGRGRRPQNANSRPRTMTTQKNGPTRQHGCVSAVSSAFPQRGMDAYRGVTVNHEQRKTKEPISSRFKSLPRTIHLREPTSCSLGGARQQKSSKTCACAYVHVTLVHDMQQNKRPE